MDIEPPKDKPQIHDYATLLWNTSTNIFLSNKDVFLRTFTNGTFSNKKIIENIEKSLANGVPIGAPSAMGSNKLVTLDGGNKYVVKTMVICPDDIHSAGTFKQMICKEAITGDTIFRVPSSYNRKQILLTPNYFSESLIGILLSSNTIKTFTPSFPKIYGFQYDSVDPHKKAYTIMEPLDPVMPLLKTEQSMLYFFFQIAAALNAAQKYGRYTHYDLHTGNVLSRPKSKDIMRTYELNNGKYLYTLFDFDTVIIDFGMNRMETKDEIIIPKVAFPSPDGSLPDAFNFYEFNPYYDLFTIIYFTLFIDGNVDGKLPLANTPELGIIRDKLLSMFLGIKNDTQEIYKHISGMFVNYWRPNPNAFGTKIDGGISPVTPENYMSLIASLIEKITKTQYGDINTFSDAQIAQILRDWGLIVLDKLVNFNGMSDIKGGVVHPLISAKNAMNTIYYPVQTLNNGSMPYVKIETSHQIIDNASQYIHVASIDQRRGIRDGGYRFKLSCCRVDIRNFFRTDNIKYGVAINGGFFRIKSDFSPVGYYRTNDMVSKNNVPQMYAQNYGMVGIYKNGYLGLSKEISETLSASFDEVLSVGPVLLWDGEIITTEQYINEVDGGIAKFHCVKAFDNMDPQLDYFTADGGQLVPNCDKISPGELSHAANVNPRSAICVNSKTGIVSFVYVEGRQQRGVGMSVVQLANYCKSIGATHAVNLDGGGSSQLVWRSPGENVIGQTNPQHNFAYPVGNIISFICET